MSITIRNESLAGHQVWLGDGLVSFDAEGVAVGVVKRDGFDLNPPAPVGPSQVAHARAAEGFTLDGEDAAEDAQETLQDAAEAPAAESGAEAHEEGPAAAEDAAAPESEEAAGGGPDLPDLDALKRNELWALVQELGIDLPFVGSSSEDFQAAIRDEWRRRGLIE